MTKNEVLIRAEYDKIRHDHEFVRKFINADIAEKHFLLDRAMEMAKERVAQDGTMA